MMQRMKENLKNLRLEFEKENTYFSVCCQHYALILVCCQHYALILICCQHYALILDGDDNYSVFGYGYEHRRHSRRRSRSLMRRWHKTCFLAARTLHISFILPPAPVVTQGLIAPVRCLKALRCFLSASFKDPSHPRQCSHAHILARSYHEAADMRSWGHGAWRHESLGRGLHYLLLMCRVHNLSSLVSKNSLKKFWKLLARKERLIWMVFLGKSFYELTSFCS